MRLLPVPVLLACLLVPALNAQVAAGKPDRFAAEPAVIERFDNVIVMQPDGTGYREQTVQVRIQSEAAVHDFSVVSFGFASASEHVDLHYLRVRRVDGSVVETPATDAQEQPTAVTREAPFYSDQKEKQLPVRSLRVGDTLEWQVRILRTKAEAPNQFWGEEGFSDAVVTLEQSVELHVAKGSPARVWTNPAITKPAESDTAAEHVYRWQHDNLKPTTGKEADAAREAAKKKVLTPAEELDAREGKLPDLAWSTFPTWAAVGDWYRGLEHDRDTPDAEIKAKVSELTAGKTSQQDKVHAVYDYASLQVRYVGVAFGVGRYQPHAASDVLSNQYGDCKDKHTLLAAMLTELGLHPHAVLIGQGVRFNEALPSPGAFNHLITQVDMDGKPVWLDSTAETAPFGMLLYQIRDKQALVIPDTGPAQLERTPKNPPFAPYERMTAVGSLNKDGISESHLVLTLHGDEEAYLRAGLRQLSPAKYDAFVQALVSSLGYGGTTSHASFSRLDDTSTPLAISFDYHREKAGDWDNYRIIPQLLPVGLGPVDPKEPPVRAIQLGIPGTFDSTAEMKLPDGWGAELPVAVHEKSAFATYDQTYRLDKATLYTERKLTTLTESIPASDWKAYKAWGDKVNLGGDLYVQLTRVNTKPDKGSSPRVTAPGKDAALSEPPSDSGVKADELTRQAYDAIKTKDWQTALSLLDKARSLNAEQRGLWSAYAFIAIKNGRQEEAIADYRRELDLHPDIVQVYPMLADIQAHSGHSADIPGTLRAWIKADPQDPKPVEALLQILNAEDQPEEAVTVAQAALTNLPEEARKRPALLVAYGNAQLKSGKEADGLATLTRVLHDSSTDSNALNSAAYALAEANKDLPLAESTQRGVLSQLETESQTFTGNEAPQTLASKSSLLFASWDTMGWILFREGKLKDSESYVNAAFINRPNAEVGTHLGDIRAAAGDPSGARHAYQLAVPALSYRYNGMVETPATKRMRDALEGKIETMQKAGAHAEPAGDLDDLRKVHLGPANGRNLSAEYRVLLTAAGVKSAAPTGEKSVRGGTELIRAMKVPHLFPAASDALLVKLAILNCHAETCDLIFEP